MPAFALLPEVGRQLAELPRQPDRALQYLRDAFRENNIDALSMLLSLNTNNDEMVIDIERLADELLRLALPRDAAECALLLLNHVEELRRDKEINWRNERDRQEALTAWNEPPEAKRRRRGNCVIC